jgi:uncharacterized membrane protein
MSQPQDPYGSNPSSSGYPPPNYGTPPGYNAPPPPPPGYNQPGAQPGGPAGGQPGGGYGAPPPPGSSQGYGAPQPGYPQPGYGGQPGGQFASQFSVGDAFNWAWQKFKENAAAILVAAAIYVVGIGILFSVVWFGIFAATSTTDQYGYPRSSGPGIGALVLGLVVYFLIFAVGFYMQASFVSGALDIADGRPVTIATFFKPRNLGPAVLVALLVGLASALLACTFIGGLLVAFFAQFAIAFAIDRSLSPINAIKASFSTVRDNLGPSALSYLVQYAAQLVGALACGIGAIVGMPIALLIQVYTYRKLTGGQVAEAAQPGYQQGPPPGIPPGPQYR